MFVVALAAFTVGYGIGLYAGYRAAGGPKLLTGRVEPPRSREAELARAALAFGAVAIPAAVMIARGCSRDREPAAEEPPVRDVTPET